MTQRGKEYAKKGDRLSNFKRVAATLGGTPERALVGIWAKQLISLLDIIDDLDQGKVATREMWIEKLRDNRNYIVLLHGLIEERLANKPQS